MVILLFTLIIALAIFLVSAIIHIGKIKKELVAIDREQHEQNNDIIKLMKSHMTHQEMISQHIEVLQYLIEQDPKIGKKIPYTGVVGQA
jgi:cell division septal protein FtsQ